MKAAVHRRVLRTVLLVGEGDAEEVLLRHLKRLYVPRGSGLAVTIKNARGKGAAHVVDFALRQSRNAAFDAVLVLCDGDAAWSDRVAAAARKGRIEVLICEPCLEALLLEAFGHRAEGLTSAQLKHRFEGIFGRPAHDAHYLIGADAAFFERTRQKVPSIAVLLKMLAS